MTRSYQNVIKKMTKRSTRSWMRISWPSSHHRQVLTVLQILCKLMICT